MLIIAKCGCALQVFGVGVFNLSSVVTAVSALSVTTFALDLRSTSTYALSIIKTPAPIKKMSAAAVAESIARFIHVHPFRPTCRPLHSNVLQRVAGGWLWLWVVQKI